MNYADNIRILEENNIRVCGTAWNDKPDSVELETYTDAGEDMIIILEYPNKKELQSYIDNFDIDEEVLLWWGNGINAAHKAGVPFDNIREHYDDYEAYLAELQKVCNLLS